MESFTGGRLIAAAEKTPGPPVRFVTLFFPNGVYPTAWQVKQGAKGLQFGESLEPLGRFADRCVVVDGLDNPLSGHLGQTSGFLSGVDFAPNEQGVVTAGVSLDQMLARQWGGETFIPSLNLGLEPPSQGGFGDRPRSYGNSISWSSPTSKIEPQINPQQAFDQVFLGQTEAGRRAAGRRKRIVDEIWGSAKTLQPKISLRDRQKLNQYLDSMRDLESKLDKAMNPVEKKWAPVASPKLNRPEKSGIPTRHDEHMRLMLDIMVLALQTDSTRVATLVMGHSISRVVYDFADPSIKRNHHDLSHHRNSPDKIKAYNHVTRWFAGQARYFLEQMDDIDEGNGSLLDNSLVLYGSGMKDGNVHEPVNVPVALFGRAGNRLKTNRLITCPSASKLAQLHLSLLHVFGVEADSFNQVTDKVLPGFAWMAPGSPLKHDEGGR
ncbi:MAG: DUF1552 domain-containing protein [Verrucomicrobiota bacterium]